MRLRATLRLDLRGKQRTSIRLWLTGSSYSRGGHASSLLLKLRTDTFLGRGASIAFLSAFANEQECLFPPLTYLKPTGKRDEVHLDGWSSETGGCCAVTVVEVVPHLGSA